ncbi:MAG: T9SS type A sorting domain-containing protein [Candidatus Eisenbacteria bacterium]|uniref:T9SS type A sorting domain-containing protein n=1 Tax=Eiseniibacteriota bacterium TaxID=2212470 RepID=A0A948W7S6_UNCEI|nr:T9SS type A sorting domain-containing protein [Candidatus Eisenbacteria bacterium]MBU1949678.1 T9SS type A sorting domain-containing protein [Candidatus Eisenbacteria bacterium]MBU2691961.1 T9SS type A sorting domain-containing protein [Candidatus Eisenbacteria bacterium]
MRHLIPILILTLTFVATPAVASLATMVEVPGSIDWTDTGITLMEGDVVLLLGHGRIHTDPLSHSNNCYSPAGSAAGDAGADYPLPGGSCYALLGRIGEGDIFVVSDFKMLTAGASGPLYLGPNDNFVSDNHGVWDVVVLPGVEWYGWTRVEDNNGWVDTGFDIGMNEEVCFTASGRFFTSSDFYTGNHTGPSGQGWGAGSGSYPAPDLTGMSLVGRIADCDPFPIGDLMYKNFPDCEGRLHLCINDQGWGDNHDSTWHVFVASTGAVSSIANGNPVIPGVEFSMFPNPALARTHIALDLPEAGPVKIQVFDASGRSVATLLDETLSAGRHEIEWNGCSTNGRPVAPGVYFCQSTTESQVLVRKLSIAR